MCRIIYNFCFMLCRASSCFGVFQVVSLIDTLIDFVSLWQCDDVMEAIIIAVKHIV